MKAACFAWSSPYFVIQNESTTPPFSETCLSVNAVDVHDAERVHLGDELVGEALLACRVGLLFGVVESRVRRHQRRSRYKSRVWLRAVAERYIELPFTRDLAFRTHQRSLERERLRKAVLVVAHMACEAYVDVASSEDALPHSIDL